MSGGPYIVNFGSKLGQVQNPMAGAAAPNLATYNPVEGAIWSKWKPVGESIQEGLQSGIKEGESLGMYPEQKQALQLANQSAIVDAAAKQAQIEQTEAQTYGILRSAAGPYANTTQGPKPFTPTAAATAQTALDQMRNVVGLKAAVQNARKQVPGENPRSQGGAGGGGGTGSQDTGKQPPQTTTQGAQPQPQDQLPEGVPPEVSDLGVNGVSPGGASYGDVQMHNPTNVTPVESARTSWAQANQPQQGQTLNVANSGLGTPNVKDLGIDPRFLQQGSDGTYTIANPQKNLNMSPDGRYFAGMAPTGAPVYYDPLKNDTYVYTPEAGGKERRFYSRYTNDDEWQHGVENVNPQEQQRQGWIDYLNDPKNGAAATAFYGENADPNWANHSSSDLLSAVELLRNQQAREPLSEGERDEMQKRMAELDSGNKVMQALGQLQPGEYNALTSAIKGYGNKFATTPVIGDIIKGLGATPSPNLTNLLQSYGAYLDAARGVTTGTMRANEPEMKALMSSIGSPTEDNWDFAKRFGNNLNQQRLNFIDRNDALLAQGKRMSWIEPTPRGMNVKVMPWLDRADQLRPLVAGYAENVRKDVPIPSGTPNAPTAQATPTPKPGASPPLKTIATREDLANVPDGQGAMFGTTKLTPKQVQAAKNKYMQSQGQ